MGFVQLGREKSDAVQDWKKKSGGTRAQQTIPKYLVMSLFGEERIQIEAEAEVEAWRKQLLASPRPIGNLPDHLRQYQREGVQWMSHLCDCECHGLLADEMGLGKTVQVISLMAARPTDSARHLVVAPASVIPVWQQEFARFCPEMPVQVLRGGSTFADEDAGAGVWLASYTQLRRHVELLKKVEFGYAVLDEGQLIKNPDAKITRCCFSIRSKHRLVLTGTPLENRQLDLWSLFRFLMPHLLGQRAAFEAAIIQDAEGFIKRLRKQVAPFVLRRTKQKVAAELPRKIEMNLIAPLTDRQRDEYGRICREGLNRLGDSLSDTMRERSFGLFSLLTRLRQVCCDPGLLPWSNDPWEESGKINLLLENLAAVVEGGHKVVIFSQFVALLKRVEQALDFAHPGLKRFVLTGSTLDRQGPVEEFQTCAGPAVMLVSLRAGGTGITLHAADYVFLLDPWWNPAVEAQAIDRVHRIGQEKTVFVYRLVTGGTVEERIQELKEQKRDLFDSVIGGMGGTGDLRETYASLKELIELDDL
jgi:SNF2 family DNA or RNA helicase